MNRGIKDWPCYVLAATLDGQKMTSEETEQLAGRDNGKSQYGVAKAGWFEYMDKLNRYLQFPGVVTGKSKRVTVAWDKIYELSGNHEGLSENTAKKLYTARNKMLEEFDTLDENPLWIRMQAIHQEYGYNNPIKLKMFTEEKNFWQLPNFSQVSAINDFIDCVKQKLCKGTYSDWVGLLQHVVARMLLSDHLSKTVPDADFLPDYQEALQRGDLHWLEEDFQNNEYEGPCMVYVINSLKNNVPVASLSAPVTPPPVPKSPLARKPATQKMEVDDGPNNGEDFDQDDKTEQQGNSPTASQATPADLTKADHTASDQAKSDSTKDKPVKSSKAKSAKADEGTATKKGKKTEKAKDKTSPVGSPKKSEGNEKEDTPPWKQHVIDEIKGHFTAHYTVVSEFSHIELGQKASILFYTCTGKINNSHWNLMMRSVLQDARVVILCEPEHVRHIFDGLQMKELTLEFDFKYTAVTSTPPSRFLVPNRPGSTAWDFYFLKVKRAPSNFINTDENFKSKSRSPFWSHGVFKPPTLEETLRSKASVASPPLYPRQPPVKVFQFLIEAYAPADAIVMAINEVTGALYIACVLQATPYIGYMLTNVKDQVEAHVTRYIANSLQSQEDATSMSNALATMPIKTLVHVSDEDSDSEPIGYTPTKSHQSTEARTPETPFVPGMITDSTPETASKKRKRDEAPASPTTFSQAKKKK